VTARRAAPISPVWSVPDLGWSRRGFSGSTAPHGSEPAGGVSCEHGGKPRPLGPPVLPPEPVLSQKRRGADAVGASLSVVGLVVPGGGRMMDESVAASDDQKELRELRMRAYGPHRDIEDDPAAMARLAELEGSHFTMNRAAGPAEIASLTASGTETASPLAPTPTERSRLGSSLVTVTDRAPLAAKGRSFLALAVGAVLAVAAVVATAVLGAGPRADAILHPSGAVPDDRLVTVMESEGQEYELNRSALRGSSEMEIDLSTLRAFGTYRDIEVWSAVNVFESPCLIAFHRTSLDVVARECVPAGVDLFIDTAYHGLEAGERLRFFLRGDTVEAYLLTPEEAG